MHFRKHNNTDTIINDLIGPTLGDLSDGGHIITQKEYQFIQNHPSIPTQDNRMPEDIDSIITLLNTTSYNWRKGILKGNNTIDYLALNSTLTQIAEGEIHIEEVGLSN